MKTKQLPSQLFFILVGLLFIQSVSAGLSLQLKDGKNIKLYDKSYALVIGVSNYDEWPDLPGVEDDLDEVSSVLEKHGFTVIQVKDPSRLDFDAAMRKFISQYGQDANNRLLFYFAGHGHSLKSRYGGQLGYIIPTNAALPDSDIGKFKQKAISMLEMEIYAKQMESKHALFLFDSCFSGSLFALTRSIPPVISSKLALPVRQFITAGSADQKVPDESIFRSQFVEALEGAGDANNDGYITGTEIAQFLENKVTNYSRSAQTPQYGKIRDPYLDKGDFLFFRSDFLKKKYEKKSQKKEKIVQVKKVDSLKLELSYWDSIKTSNDAVVINSYIKKYPKGQFTKLAKLKVESIERKSKSEEDERKKLKNESDLQRKKLSELLLNQERLNEKNKQLAKENADALRRMEKSGGSSNNTSLMFSGANNKIVVGAYSDMEPNWNSTVEEYSMKMVSTLRERLKKYVNHQTQFYDIVDFDLLEDMHNSDEYSYHVNSCQKHTADYIIYADFEDLQDYTPHWKRSMRASIFDCQTQEYAEIKFTPGFSENEKYTLEKNIGSGFNKFVRNYLRGEVELSRISN